MIELINVSKYYPTEFGRHYVFRNVSLALPIDKSVGVLGPNGAGKSTFLRLIGGADMPSEGKILRTGRISPPMGLTPGLQASLTASENARFAGRIYGLTRDDINDLIEYVRQLADIGKYFDMPVGTYSSGMKQRVSFAINMSMNFDYYLFDEIGAGGDKDFRKITSGMVKERLKTSKFIMTSHRTEELLEICDSGIVIQNGELNFYDDIRDALAAYGEEDEKPVRRKKRVQRSGELPDENAIGSPAETEAVDVSAVVSDPVRRARRVRRRADHETPPQDAVIAEAPVQEPEVLAVAPEIAVEDEQRKNQREQRRLKRELLKQAAASVEAPVSEPEVLAAVPAITVEEEDRKVQRVQRRLKRKNAQQDAASAEVPASEPEVLATAPAIIDEDEERKAQREQRRLKRKIAQQDAALVEVPASEPEVLAEASDTRTEDEKRTTRRNQLRLTQQKRKNRVKRETGIAVETAEVAPVLEGITAMDDPLPESPAPLAAISPPHNLAPVPPVGRAPFAQRLKPRPAPEPEVHLQQEPAAAIPVPGVPAMQERPVTLPPPVLAGSKGLLLQRALLRQERSQITAARAARLLLQHLEDMVTAGRTASQARAWLVAAAQETAALEAAQARQMLDGIAAREGTIETAASLHPAASGIASGGASAAGGIRSGIRHLSPSAANQD